MILDKYKAHFVWIGDPVMRLFKGIKHQLPHRIFVVLESRNPRWLEFQQEKLSELKAALGGAFSDAIEEIKDEEFDEKLGDIENYGYVVASMFKRIRLIKSRVGKDYERAEVTWDITAAPAGVGLFIAMVASLASSENCQVIVQHVQRLRENDPITHATAKSTYRAKHLDDMEGISSKPLAEWRQMESDDSGSEIRQIRLPRFKLELLEENEEADAKRIVFLRIPPSSCPMISTRDIEQQLDDEESGIVHKAALTRAKYGRSPSTKKTASERLKRSKDIWLSTTVLGFRDSGLVEAERRGLRLYARKSYCGDLFTQTVMDLVAVSHRHI